jgi:hypothetical protein
MNSYVYLDYGWERVSPHKRKLQERDTLQLDRQFESLLSRIGRICAAALAGAIGFGVLAALLGSPIALLGTVLMLVLVAAALRVGEQKYRKYAAAQQTSRSYELPRS